MNDPNDPAEIPQSVPVSPEMIASVLQMYNDEALLAEIREMQNGGGYQLDDFIGELEEIARRANEPTSREG